jgi:hypothetical protein
LPRPPYKARQVVDLAGFLFADPASFRAIRVASAVGIRGAQARRRWRAQARIADDAGPLGVTWFDLASPRI